LAYATLSNVTHLRSFGFIEIALYRLDYHCTV
jgi:hypothetical protein